MGVNGKKGKVGSGKNTVTLSKKAAEIAERLGQNVGEPKPLGDRNDRVMVKAPKYEYKDKEFLIHYKKVEFIDKDGKKSKSAKSSGRGILMVAHKGAKVLNVVISWGPALKKDIYEIMDEVSHPEWSAKLNELYENLTGPN